MLPALAARQVPTLARLDPDRTGPGYAPVTLRDADVIEHRPGIAQLRDLPQRLGVAPGPIEEGELALSTGGVLQIRQPCVGAQHGYDNDHERTTVQHEELDHVRPHYQRRPGRANPLQYPLQQ